jgi:hypothetical protein
MITIFKLVWQKQGDDAGKNSNDGGSGDDGISEMQVACG